MCSLRPGSLNGSCVMGHAWDPTAQEDQRLKVSLECAENLFHNRIGNKTTTKKRGVGRRKSAVSQCEDEDRCHQRQMQFVLLHPAIWSLLSEAFGYLADSL